MVEIVSQIKTAEEQADEIRRTGRQKARQMKDEAVAEGKRLVESESQKAARQAAQVISEAEARAKAYLEEFAVKSAGECKGLSGQAEARLPQAATFIVERIVERL